MEESDSTRQMTGTSNNARAINPHLMEDVSNSIVVVRDQPVILDVDVARLYGVETKRINEAVRNNPAKFPNGYMFELTSEELDDLRSKFSTTNVSPKSRTLPKVFTERGLYMIATILKSRRAVDVTFAIIETYATVREVKRELLDLHKETDKNKQVTKMQRFGDLVSEIVMPDLEVSETESTLELNFFIGKIKHTVKRIKKVNPTQPANEPPTSPSREDHNGSPAGKKLKQN